MSADPKDACNNQDERTMQCRFIIADFFPFLNLHKLLALASEKGLMAHIPSLLLLFFKILNVFCRKHETLV